MAQNPEKISRVVEQLFPVFKKNYFMDSFAHICFYFQNIFARMTIHFIPAIPLQSVRISAFRPQNRGF